MTGVLIGRESRNRGRRMPPEDKNTLTQREGGHVEMEAKIGLLLL